MDGGRDGDIGHGTDIDGRAGGGYRVPVNVIRCRTAIRVQVQRRAVKGQVVNIGAGDTDGSGNHRQRARVKGDGGGAGGGRLDDAVAANHRATRDGQGAGR